MEIYICQLIELDKWYVWEANYFTKELRNHTTELIVDYNNLAVIICKLELIGL